MQPRRRESSKKAGRKGIVSQDATAVLTLELSGKGGVHKKNAMILVCRTHRSAETAIKELQKSGCDIRELSIIGMDCPGARDVSIGTILAEKKQLAELRSFWCRMWRLMQGDAFLNVAGIGPIIAAGPLAESMLTIWPASGICGTPSALRTTMYSIGIPPENVDQCEEALQMKWYLVILHQKPASTAMGRQKPREPAVRQVG
jgi:hypothetical protein